MRSPAPVLALFVLLAGGGLFVSAEAAGEPAASSARPAVSVAAQPAGPSGRSIVLILADDMRRDDLPYLTHTKELLGQQGVTMTNAYAVNPVCCPSRASMLSGQYSHNTGVLDNDFPGGGFLAFDDDQTIATWLQSVGYATGYVGKYLNQYGQDGAAYVPPGWSTWQAAVNGVYAYSEPTTYNVNGRFVTRPGYETDTQTGMAQQFLRRHAGGPFLLVVSYVAPHSVVFEEGESRLPPEPAARHEHAFDGATADKTDPAYDEPDVSDKPTSLQQPPLTAQQIERTDVETEGRRESLLAVDEGVRDIIATLETEGVLDETYVAFSSDNGYLLGEHRYPSGKYLPYEPAAHVPLLIRGPDLPTDKRRKQVVGLHDLAPTFLRMAGAWGSQQGYPIDGRTLLPLIADASKASGRDLLIESHSDDAAWQDYDAIRTQSGYKYAEYADGGVELYDLTADPSEIDNLAGQPAHAELQSRLAARLDAVRSCAGSSCR